MEFLDTSLPEISPAPLYQRGEGGISEACSHGQGFLSLCAYDDETLTPHEITVEGEKVLSV